MGSAAPVGGMMAQVEGYVWMRRWQLAVDLAGNVSVLDVVNSWF